jgi:Histidine kinase-, DNA gyrase B-, and HSP90-like ATPase
MKAKNNEWGKLKIGDDWNAIRIIALSQSNPLKAIAEFVENSIDASAKTTTITRGREQGAHFLAIKGDGDGVPRDAADECHAASADPLTPARTASTLRGRNPGRL